ncbi:MAG: hypothetical protein WBG87_00220 [Stenotrophomonas maltophilia]
MFQHIARYWAAGFFLLNLMLLGARIAQAIDAAFHYAAMALLLSASVVVRKRASGLSFIQFVMRWLADSGRLLLGLVQLERRVHCSLLGRFAWMDSASDGDDQVFGFITAVDYHGTFALMVLVALIEAPFAHLLVYVFIEGESGFVLHFVLAYFNFYGLIWMIADRRAVGRSSHRLSARRLHVQMGWRSSMDIRTEDIRGVALLQSNLRNWARLRMVDRQDLAVISPLDAPNIVLEVESRDTYQSLLSSKLIPRYLALFVDEPQLLKYAVENTMSGARNE